MVDPSEYQPSTRNSNQGSERGVAAIESSVQSYGLHRGIAVTNDRMAFAGSHALSAAIGSATATEILEVDVTGTTLVASRRVDIPNANDARAIAAGLADNLTGRLNFTIEPVQLKADLAFLSEVKFDMPKVILSQIDIEGFLNAPDKSIEDGDSGDDAGIDKIASQYGIIVYCDSESEQSDLLQHFIDSGKKCKALM